MKLLLTGEDVPESLRKTMEEVLRGEFIEMDEALQELEGAPFSF